MPKSGGIWPQNPLSTCAVEDWVDSRENVMLFSSLWELKLLCSQVWELKTPNCPTFKTDIKFESALNKKIIKQCLPLETYKKHYVKCFSFLAIFFQLATQKNKIQFYSYKGLLWKTRVKSCYIWNLLLLLFFSPLWDRHI